MLDSVKFYGSATVGARGQIVIPAEARDDQGIEEGNKLIVVRGMHGGLELFTAEQIEKLIQKIQAHSGQFLEAAQAIKVATQKHAEA